jgi:hypothetical protein
MLFVNNEWVNLNLSEQDAPVNHKQYIREYNDFLKETEDFKFPVVLKLKRAKNDVNKSGHLEPARATSISFKADAQGKSGGEQWIYHTRFPEKDKNGKNRWRESNEWVRGSMIIHENQKDKLFFLMKKSPYVTRGILFHYDPVMIAKRRAEKREQENEVVTLIYSKTSPLVQNPDLLRIIAKSFGIAKVDKLSIGEIQEKLEARVKSGDDVSSKGMKAFLRACEVDLVIKSRAQIQDAIDKGIVRLSPNTREWGFADGGKITKVICKCSGRHGEELQELYEYLKTDKSSLDKIILVSETGSVIDYTAEDVDNIPWERLRDDALSVGIRVVGVKKEKVTDDMREDLSNQ